METRHVRAALKASLVKTDRRDACGMAHLLRMGWFRPVHVKTASARERRVLLGARDCLVRRIRDPDNTVRGLLRGFGLRPPRLLRERWSGTVRQLITAHPMLIAAIDPILVARDGLGEELARLDKLVRDQARDDAVCRRLMTVPGVGAVVALSYVAAVDDPALRPVEGRRACARPDPSRYQSGETDRRGAITKAGDARARVALFEAAHVNAEHKAMRARLVESPPGAEFDLAYVRGQVVDHQKAVQLLEYEIGSGQDVELKSFAAEILPIVLQHLRTAQDLQVELIS